MANHAITNDAVIGMVLFAVSLLIIIGSTEVLIQWFWKNSPDDVQVKKAFLTGVVYIRAVSAVGCVAGGISMLFIGDMKFAFPIAIAISVLFHFSMKYIPKQKNWSA